MLHFWIRPFGSLLDPIQLVHIVSRWVVRGRMTVVTIIMGCGKNSLVGASRSPACVSNDFGHAAGSRKGSFAVVCRMCAIGVDSALQHRSKATTNA
jgi:hypothetical protein